MADDQPVDVATGIERGLREAIAYRRGELELDVQIIDPMPASRVRAIRKLVAKSPREFQAKFAIPARTVEGWEQGRAMDATARALFTIIEKAPEAAERAMRKSA